MNAEFFALALTALLERANSMRAAALTLRYEAVDQLPEASFLTLRFADACDTEAAACSVGARQAEVALRVEQRRRTLREVA